MIRRTYSLAFPIVLAVPYDAADRMTQVGTLTYGYDNNGNLTTRGSDAFAWDAANRMTSATVAGTTTTFAYNGDNLRNSRTAGVSTTFTWDVAGFWQNLKSKDKSVSPVLDDGAFKYVHGVGRIAEVGPGATTHYYLPDGLGSTMALVDGTGVVVNTYNYDIFGEMRSSTGTQANEFKFTGEQFDALGTVQVPNTLRLPLDAIISVTNLTGATVANLQDDPDSADANWATATTVDDTVLRVGFPTPSQALRTGAGLQEFRVLLRKNASGGNAPTYDLELWETGGAARLALLANAVTLSSDLPIVVSATWNSSLLTTADGSKVELRIVGHRSNGSPSARRTVEVGAVEWNAATFTPSQKGLYYLRARYYDPEVGRFLGLDRAEPDYKSPASLNRFAYVTNNPVNLADPLGLCGWLDPWNCVQQAGSYAAQQFLPSLPSPSNGYMEIALTGCYYMCINVGFQYTSWSNIHPVASTGFGGGWGINTLYFPDGQTISNGYYTSLQGNIGVPAFPYGPAGEAGFGGGGDNFYYGYGSGIGTTGAAWLFGWVFPDITPW